MTDDETARVNLRQVIVLELADAFVLGWREMVLLELDRMRRMMPYADRLELTLVCERKPDV